MFTGIIENSGIVLKKEKKNRQVRFTFRLHRREKLKTGESIAVSGVCLTVAKAGGDFFSAAAIGETLAATTLSGLKAGERVNLERSLKVGDRIGGHFVTGHVDGRGVIEKIERKGANRTFQIRAPAAVRPYLALKGSVAVDGISLTVQSVKGPSFKVGFVPHTLKVTTLGNKKPGDLVNLEADLIARYLSVLRDPKSSLRTFMKLFPKTKPQGS